MVIQEHTEAPILGTRSNVQLPFDTSGLTFSQRIKLRLNGMVYVGDHREVGWKRSIPVYVFRCRKHGLQQSYPVGFAQRLLCPECLKAGVQ